MTFNFQTSIAGFVIICGFLAGASARGESFEVTLSDPLYPDRPAKTYPVSIALDQQGFPTGYRFHLVAATCFDGKCKPLDATLQWDALGRYAGLSVAPHRPLTKKEHTPFGRQDYERLDRILSDTDSLLGRHPLEFFAPKPKEPAHTVEVDGVSEATPLAVQDAVVSGAAYSSWVLWRWVNGQIVDQLLARTRLLSGDDHLLRCLDSPDRRFVEFALCVLLERGLEAPRHQRACYRILEHSGRANCELTLKLLLEAPPDLDGVHRQLIALIGKNGGSSRLILNYFRDVADPGADVWVQLAKQLNRISGYWDLSLALDVLAKRAGGSAAVRSQVEMLLKRENRFIVRRAGEFLEQQDRSNAKSLNDQNDRAP